MPTYPWHCPNCEQEFDVFCEIEDRNKTPRCEDCGAKDSTRVQASPAVMNHSYPDGNRRFDGVRQARKLEDAVRRERDAKVKKKLQAEQRKLNKIEE